MRSPPLPYSPEAPTREALDQRPGWTLLQFGTDWCGHCQAAEPLIEAAAAAHPAVQRIKVEDGSGRPLGRSYRVKLWPTLVLLRNGQELERLVRPTDQGLIDAALHRLVAHA